MITARIGGQLTPYDLAAQTQFFAQIEQLLRLIENHSVLLANLMIFGGSHLEQIAYGIDELPAAAGNPERCQSIGPATRAGWNIDDQEFRARCRNPRDLSVSTTAIAVERHTPTELQIAPRVDGQTRLLADHTTIAQYVKTDILLGRRGSGPGSRVVQDQQILVQVIPDQRYPMTSHPLVFPGSAIDPIPAHVQPRCRPLAHARGDELKSWDPNDMRGFLLIRGDLGKIPFEGPVHRL